MPSRSQIAGWATDTPAGIVLVALGATPVAFSVLAFSGVLVP